MALSALTVVEVRPATGSDTNSGGFVTGATGTDFSQQAAAQYALTGLTTAAANAIILTASAAADMVGNLFRSTGGTNFIAGVYQIVSVVVGVSFTVDRNCTSAAGAAGTGNIGGALATIANAEAFLVAGNTAWIKGDGTSQVLTVKISLTNSGDSTSGPITWAGYHSTRGDHDGTRPIITSSTNNCDLVNDPGSAINFRVFDNIEFSSTAGTPGNGIASDTGAGTARFWVVSNCYIHGVKNGLMFDGSTYNICPNLFVIGCEISSCTVTAISVGDLTTIDGCYLHGNTGYGVNYLSNIARSTAGLAYPVVLRNTVIYGNSLGGVYIQSAAAATATTGPYFDIARCAIVSNTNDGIQVATANAKLVMLSLENTILYGNSGYGVNITNTAATIIANRNNAYGSNTSGARLNLAVGTGDVALSADPFTAKAANDFSLNSTAGGGTACKAVGFPGTIAGCASSGSSDIGAQQSAAASTFIAPAPQMYTRASTY